MSKENRKPREFAKASIIINKGNEYVKAVIALALGVDVSLVMPDFAKCEVFAIGREHVGMDGAGIECNMYEITGLWARGYITTPKGEHKEGELISTKKWLCDAFNNGDMPLDEVKKYDPAARVYENPKMQEFDGCIIWADADEAYQYTPANAYDAD